MNTTSIKSQHFFPTPIKTTPSNPKFSNFISSNSPAFLGHKNLIINLSSKHKNWVIKSSKHEIIDNDELVFKRRLQVFTGAASIGLLLMMMGQDKAWALGPEGPLMEEFWENVRRYALYALTVSTGVIYTILQPIVELLKNPISAILIVVIIGGSFYMVSQIVSAMVGVSDFSYQYAY
ncbi:uncharacterized protein LOC110731221 [Chenopodium quinoa]|uniref:uncharacterized protein LOC110731221 n=1 Tax=Chenopodium quinoa TaxID=63459 RepID=UPI000B7874DE|nr:uncharacterized protein LOC110731221 [Chenopodium quinoa]